MTEGHHRKPGALRTLRAKIALGRDNSVFVIALGGIFGDTRAVMIEGPSHEAIELVEVK